LRLPLQAGLQALIAAYDTQRPPQPIVVGLVIDDLAFVSLP
jgi:hypothetical protein